VVAPLNFRRIGPMIMSDALQRKDSARVNNRRHFLEAARRTKASSMVIHDRHARTVAGEVEIADTSETRRRGLLGRTGLAPGAALIIAPCSAVHTFFMKFPIDVAFVDRSGHVVKTVCNLVPWRIAGALRAWAVIEMAAGMLEARGVNVGDTLTLEAREANVEARPTSDDSPVRASRAIADQNETALGRRAR
jgi:uncharacterized membrane protein (UPF0127 family)